MKREFLEGLGLEKSVIDKIMDENGRDIEAEKNNTEAVKGQLDVANNSIKDLKSDLKKFEGADIDGLKTKITEWETKYNTDIETERSKATNIKREFALKTALKNAGVKDPDYVMFKQGGVEKFSFSDKDEVIGLEEILKPVKDSNPDWFNSNSANGGSSDSENNGRISVSFGSSSDGGDDRSGINAFMNDAIRGAFAD